VDNSLRQVLLMRQATGELLPIRRGEDAGLIGLNRGHAEYTTVPETPVFPIPKGVDVHTAADISCAYGTAYRALREAGTGPGTSLVIIGVGGVGLAAVELAGALSARPIVAVDVREPPQECGGAGRDVYGRRIPRRSPVDGEGDPAAGRRRGLRD